MDDNERIFWRKRFPELLHLRFLMPNDVLLDERDEVQIFPSTYGRVL